MQIVAAGRLLPLPAAANASALLGLLRTPSPRTTLLKVSKAISVAIRTPRPATIGGGSPFFSRMP